MTCDVILCRCRSCGEAYNPEEVTAIEVPPSFLCKACVAIRDEWRRELSTGEKRT